jgi:propanol-preferring alcohol dehydrogenase
MPYLGTGLGRDGGMAEYLTVPARNLVPLGDADPVAAAPLSDAGLTPYHAIKKSLPALAGGGKHALVIGLGGLGQVAVQILTALTGATVIATDMKEDAMARAAANGAVTVPGGPDQAAAIRELTGGKGVDAVFDFVGAKPTIALAMGVVALKGRVTVVGIANGAYEWNFYGVPYEVELTSTYWGTIEELHEVVDLYRAGQVTPDVTVYALDDALEAYRALEAGELSGRAVVAPHGRG